MYTNALHNRISTNAPRQTYLNNRTYKKDDSLSEVAFLPEVNNIHYIARKSLHYVMIFNPTAATKIIAMNSSRFASLRSPNRSIPVTVLPTVPIPVHTA